LITAVKGSIESAFVGNFCHNILQQVFFVGEKCLGRGDERKKETRIEARLLCAWVNCGRLGYFYFGRLFEILHTQGTNNLGYFLLWATF
jgi:hypothetical protein